MEGLGVGRLGIVMGKGEQWLDDQCGDGLLGEAIVDKWVNVGGLWDEWG